jgi:predicted phosphodiesterase
MLVAIVSDIHGNLEAFQAVINDMDSRKPDVVINLGDLIGYGPDPEEVVQLFRQKGFLSVLGNHEAVLVEKRIRNWFNFQAKDNSVQTEQMLRAESIDFCRGLQRSLIVAGGVFVHGFPPDSVLHYLNRKSDKEVCAFFNNTDQDLFFVGHTHDLKVVSWDGFHLQRETFVDRKYNLQHGYKYIINAGSVGQPRDGDNSAKYLLWQTEINLIEVKYIRYDWQMTAGKIRERGFPEAYAQRLG